MKMLALCTSIKFNISGTYILAGVDTASVSI